MSQSDVLTAPLVIEYPFSRTTGPVIGAFFTALREGFVVGVKAADGRVIVPPVEYDPLTAEDLTEIVEVGDAGVVTTWCWVADPVEGQPLDRPFAWALITLDGADTPMLHAVDTGGDVSRMATGMRVKARWRPARPEGADPDSDDGVRYREGHILDIECFEPEGPAGAEGDA
ncbi:MAG: OB-fold domain-containing protein [Acidimicrobiales bacterium]